MLVTAEQREHFAREGYLIFDPELSSDLLDGIVADLNGKYDESGPPLNVTYRDHTRIQDAWRINALVKSIALAPKTLSLLQGLYGRKPLPFQTLNFPKGTEQPAHADAIHFNSVPPTFACGVWVALEDVDMNNGPLTYYPGSHKLPEITIADLETFRQRIKLRLLRRPVKKSDFYPIYERFIARVIERQQLHPSFATIKKGQALVWAANLLHGGAVQLDKSRSRHSQVTHYFFEDCRYYTPILSRGAAISWRRPEWIE